MSHPAGRQGDPNQTHPCCYGNNRCILGVANTGKYANMLNANMLVLWILNLHVYSASASTEKLLCSQLLSLTAEAKLTLKCLNTFF